MNRTSNNILKCILLLVVLTSMSGVASAEGAPNITSFAPASPVSDIAGASRTFNITANQTVNVTWYINGTIKQLNESVLKANYTNISAAKGIWIVNATATNTTTGLSASKEWTWNVTTPPPSPGAPNITSFAPASPVSDIAGASRTFNITANQTVNVTWYINGYRVQLNESVLKANYTNISAAEGIWIVNATATNTTTGLSASKEWTWRVSVANITGFTLDSSGTRGKWINASVNITNSGSTSHWFVIDVSGVNVANGYPLVGTATVRLNAGETFDNIPMRITVPPSASTGTYNLTAGIWKLGDFAIPDKLVTTKGPKIVIIS